MAYFGEAVAQAGLIGIALGLALAARPDRQRAGRDAGRLGLAAAAQPAAGWCRSIRCWAWSPMPRWRLALSPPRWSSGPQVDLMAFLFGDIFAITGADLRWIYLWRRSAPGARLVWLWRPLLRHQRARGSGRRGGNAHGPRQAACLCCCWRWSLPSPSRSSASLLTIAFLIMPAAAARPLSETPEQMAVFAADLRHAVGCARSVPVGRAGYAGRAIDRADAGRLFH